MKPLVLVLTVVLFATLLNLVSAATKPGSKVVASYNEYEKRQFPQETTFACVRAWGWNNMNKAEKWLQSMAAGNNDQKKTVPLGKGLIMIKPGWLNLISYCKLVPGGYAGPTHIRKNRKKTMTVSKPRPLAFYARKAANKSAKAIQTTAAMVVALVAVEKDRSKRFRRGTLVVEITAANEVYVGPIAY